MNDKLCPECGHNIHSPGACHGRVSDDGGWYRCQCNVSMTKGGWYFAGSCVEWQEPEIAIKINDEVARERDEARAWAIYWRKMYDDKMYRSVDLDCKVYIAEDERSEAVRDLRDAENEIKRLRLLILNMWEMGDPGVPSISDGFGTYTCAWCAECGGDMQVVRPGKFQCQECGK